MDHFLEIAVDSLFGSPAVKAFSPFIPVLNLFVQAADKDGIVGEFKKVGLLLDFLFGQLAFRDVHHHGATLLTVAPCSWPRFARKTGVFPLSRSTVSQVSDD